jgi:hypothetical protein
MYEAQERVSFTTGGGSAPLAEVLASSNHMKIPNSLAQVVPFRTAWLLSAALAACGADDAGANQGAAGAPGNGAGGGDESLWCAAQQTFTARCVACHDGQNTAGAPMSLKTYADLQAPAVSDPSKHVYQLVSTRVHDTRSPMPPQQSLTAAELASLDAWIAAGAPAGDDPTCASNDDPGQMETAWPEHCDAVYKLIAHGAGGPNDPYVVPAATEQHPKISLPAPWGDQSLQAIGFRSITDNRKVLHHWILYGPAGEFLTGWAPGKKDDTPLPADVGMNLAGGSLTLDMHYNNLLGDQSEPDNSGVEICALNPENFREKTGAVFTGFTRLALYIPAHSTDVDMTGQCTVTTTTPVTLMTVSPHAHTLAHHMRFSVKRASGEEIVMHDGAFAFEEQQSYVLSPMIQLQTGDKVITTCTYDNPTDYPVTFGENTQNEMCFNFASYYPKDALKCR